MEQLAAKYPDIVDYYLHGGRGRIEHAFTTVSAYFSLSGTQTGLDVPTVTARLDTALAVLDTDPHYRYELRFGQGEPPGLVERPMLLMTWMSGHRDTGRWTAVDIIARCRASTQVRPITVSGEFIAETGSDFAEALQDFHSYGTPFHSPPGAYRGEIDAPGGLGGQLGHGTISMLPHPDNLGDNPEMHLQVVSPDGAVLAGVNVNRVDRSAGRDGVRVVLEEEHHVFRLEDRYNLAGNRGNRTLSFGTFSGQPVTAIRSALKFLAHCRAPNVGRLSIRHTPPEHGTIDPNLAFDWPEEMQDELRSLTEAIESLSVIQQHTSSPIRVPDWADVTNNQIADWHFVAAILSGHEAARRYPEGHCLIVELSTDTVVPEGTFAVTVPLFTQIGPQRIELGHVEAWLTDPITIERRTQGDHTYHAVTTLDRRVRYRLSDAATSAVQEENHADDEPTSA
ncbi:hypothetical protein AMYBAR_003838 [Amycolatopsis bartoniae]|uniref:Uncharacterized protein n=2 Tax=Amycolatopsis bartoniae TaxID=941986 RepID=A0A8H9IPL0_9PSEU|nr:hypothetical protein [Amycolatopsis bartoniae]GHF35334.1 hypothetical protein GCM10017566_05130 [Amycolatopsis bartoniae]